MDICNLAVEMTSGHMFRDDMDPDGLSCPSNLLTGALEYGVQSTGCRQDFLKITVNVVRISLT